jgi:CubicO group peptidase (beta-lactamase class C family)
MRTLILPLILILSFLSCAKKSTKLNNKNTVIIAGKEGEILDSILTPYVEELRNSINNNAGLAIGVIKGNAIIYARTFGYSNIEKKQKANFNSVFHIASLSKPFTAMAITKLVQQQKLQLDDKIIDFIPELKMKGSNYQLITIRHALSHTSGIPTNISPDDWTNPSYGNTALEENLEAIQDQYLDFEPGTKFNYSNSAFDILGIVISRASGMHFSEYITRHILEPAGMTHSTYKKPKDILPENWAKPYSFGLQTQEWTPYPYNEKLYPSSGVLTSLKDMCRWAQIHMGKGTFKNHKVLDEDYYNLLVQPQYETPWGDEIGLSWFLQSYQNRPIIMHQGQDTGFESIIYIYPNEGVSIVVMSNRDFSRTGRIINAASEILFSLEPKPYTVSAKYKFANTYNKQGIEKAKIIWQDIKNDSTDIYHFENEDILTTGAILENGAKWLETKDVLEFYNHLDDTSTYSWRLLGNANLNLGDTLTALSCYKKCLDINPNYEKAKIAIEKIDLK